MNLWTLLLPLAATAWGAAPERSRITFPDGASLLAETARTPEEQTAVLRDRAGIDPESGVLLSYETAGERIFPAEVVRSTLDLLFLDAKGVITSAQTYGVLVDSIGEGKHILALAAGSIEKRGLKAGQRLRLGEAAKAKKKEDLEEGPVREEQPKEGHPSADQVNKDMFDSLGQLKGKVPDEMYQAMMKQAAQAAQLMKDDPNADVMDVLKTVTGMDFNKLDRLAKELKVKNPGMTDEEIAQKVAAQMILDLPKPIPPKPKVP